MSSRAPIAPSDAVAEAFKNARTKSDANFGWIQVGIDMGNEKSFFFETTKNAK